MLISFGANISQIRDDQTVTIKSLFSAAESASSFSNRVAEPELRPTGVGQWAACHLKALPEELGPARDAT
jgi:hypothetical protein